MSGIHFATLNPDGTLTNERVIDKVDIANCPQYIFVADHYNADGSCKCPKSWRSSSYTLWAARLRSGAITHHQALQFCKAIYPAAYGAQTGGKHTNIEGEEARRLVELLEAKSGTLVVDASASSRGRQWLIANAKKMLLPPELTPERLAAITHFTFEAVFVHEVKHTPWGVYYVTSPEYAAHFEDGAVLQYAPAPWQAKLSKENAARGIPWSYRTAER